MSRKQAIRDLIWPAVFVVACVAILTSLGVWQLHRRDWKLDLIERIEARSKSAPVPLQQALEAAAKSGVSELEWRRVTLRGRFDHAHERHLYSLLEGAPGWRVVTPLTADDGEIVLVDRGFVPLPLKEPQSRAQGRIEGETELTGVVRAPGYKDPLGPDNDARRNQWHWRDLAGMAAGVGDASRIAPFFIEAESPPSPGGWPKSGTVTAQLPNRHLEYALTWFGLAVTALVMFGVFAYSRARGR
jgi:surfeit locus 1 family protein